MYVTGQSFVHESKLPQPLYRSQPGGSPAAVPPSMQNQRAPHLPLSLQSSHGIQVGPSHSSEGSFLWFHILWSLSKEVSRLLSYCQDTHFFEHTNRSVFKCYKAMCGFALHFFNILTNIFTFVVEWRLLHRTKWTERFTMLKILHPQRK